MKFNNRNWRLMIAVFSLTLLFASCKKETETITIQPIEKAPIGTALFLNGNFNITATGSGNYEYGCTFNVSKNGKVSQLACRMPLAGNYRVTLWDTTANPNVILAQATVTQATNQTLSFASVTPVALSTGKTYLVSLWSSTSWNYILPAVGGPISYPITSGNINITGYRWVGTAQTPITFPINADNSYIAGIADLVFQAD